PQGDHHAHSCDARGDGGRRTTPPSAAPDVSDRARPRGSGRTGGADGEYRVCGGGDHARGLRTADRREGRGVFAAHAVPDLASGASQHAAPSGAAPDALATHTTGAARTSPPLRG